MRASYFVPLAASVVPSRVSVQSGSRVLRGQGRETRPNTSYKFRPLSRVGRWGPRQATQGRSQQFCSSATRQRKERMSICKGTVGAINELRIATNLMTMSWGVFRCLSANNPHDLLIVKGRTVLKVQCKSSLNGSFKISVPEIQTCWQLSAQTERFVIEREQRRLPRCFLVAASFVNQGSHADRHAHSHSSRHFRQVLDSRRSPCGERRVRHARHRTIIAEHERRVPNFTVKSAVISLRCLNRIENAYTRRRQYRIESAGTVTAAGQYPARRTLATPP